MKKKPCRYFRRSRDSSANHCRIDIVSCVDSRHSKPRDNSYNKLCTTCLQMTYSLFPGFLFVGWVKFRRICWITLFFTAAFFYIIQGWTDVLSPLATSLTYLNITTWVILQQHFTWPRTLCCIQAVPLTAPVHIPLKGAPLKTSHDLKISICILHSSKWITISICNLPADTLGHGYREAILTKARHGDPDPVVQPLWIFLSNGKTYKSPSPELNLRTERISVRIKEEPN